MYKYPEGINDNNEEQQYFLNGRVCLFICHTIAVNFPRSSTLFLLIFMPT